MSHRHLPYKLALPALAVSICGHEQGQPCSHCILGAFCVPRPLGVCIYAFGSRPGRNRLNLLRSARLAARHSGFALGYPLATLGPHFVRRLPLRERVSHSGGVGRSFGLRRSAPVDVPGALTLSGGNPRHSALSSHYAAVRRFVRLLA